MREPLRRHTQEFTKTVLDNWKDIESMAAALPEKVDIKPRLTFPHEKSIHVEETPMLALPYKYCSSCGSPMMTTRSQYVAVADVSELCP
jgi:hypothetical protein